MAGRFARPRYSKFERGVSNHLTPEFPVLRVCPVKPLYFLSVCVFGFLSACESTPATGRRGGGNLPVILASQGGGGGSYTVSATAQPSAGTSSEQLRMAWDSVSMGFDYTTHTSSQTTLRSGKSKTLAQLIDVVEKHFGSYLANPTPGRLVGKLGDVKYGGEARFQSSAGGLDLVFLDGGGNVSDQVQMAERDVAIFRQMLADL